MDENDLDTRMQRSSDWLRSGNFSDPAETALTSDLQKLGQQVRDAARALGSAQHGSKDAALNRAMDDLSRLRDQLGGLGGRPNGQPGQSQANKVSPATWPAISNRPAQRGNGQLAKPAAAGQAGNAQSGRLDRQVKPAEARRVQSAIAWPVRSAIQAVALAIAIAIVRRHGHRQHSHLRSGSGAPTRPEPGRYAARD